MGIQLEGMNLLSEYTEDSKSVKLRKRDDSQLVFINISESDKKMYDRLKNRVQRAVITQLAYLEKSRKQKTKKGERLRYFKLSNLENSIW